MTLETEKKLINNGFKYICGIDEVGRGPIAGPILICCYILDIEKIFNISNDLFNIVNDSKKLSDKKRRKLVDFIKDISLDFSFGEASNTEIDNYGIIEANRMAIERGVNTLKIKPDYYLFDYNTCSVDFLNTPYKKIIKGDSIVFSIACSSILAKVFRDDLMIDFSKKYNKYGFEKNAGYGTAFHMSALKEFGLSEIHRKSFCKNIIKNNN